MRMNTSRDDNTEWWLRSVPVALHGLGYRTGLFGKVLNVMKTYGCDAGGEADQPPGVSRQSIMCKIEYYNATFAEGDDAVAGGAVTVRTTGALPTDYSTSIVGNASVAFVRDALANHSAQPFFVARPARAAPAAHAGAGRRRPDRPPRAAARGLLQRVGRRRHAFLPDEPTINADDWAAIKTEYSNRMRSLLSVDDIGARSTPSSPRTPRGRIRTGPQRPRLQFGAAAGRLAQADGADHSTRIPAMSAARASPPPPSCGRWVDGRHRAHHPRAGRCAFEVAARHGRFVARAAAATTPRPFGTVCVDHVPVDLYRARPRDAADHATSRLFAPARRRAEDASATPHARETRTATASTGRSGRRSGTRTTGRTTRLSRRIRPRDPRRPPLRLPLRRVQRRDRGRGVDLPGEGDQLPRSCTM